MPTKKRGLPHRQLNKSLDEALSAEDEAALKEIDRIFTRLDVEIPKAQQRMDELLARLRTTRIVKAA